MGCISCGKYVLNSPCYALKLILPNSPENVSLGTRGQLPVISVYILGVSGVTVPVFSAIILYLHTHEPLLWSDGLQQH